jgi:formylglycine-generating enzyme required for sulfatase activity
MARANGILQRASDGHWNLRTAVSTRDAVQVELPEHRCNGGNRDGHCGWHETWTNPKDGSVMRLIPQGEFLMGSTPDEIEAALKMDAVQPAFDLLHETPQFRLFVPVFYLGVFAVTNQQFARFLSEMHPGRALFELWVQTTEHILAACKDGEPYHAMPGWDRHPASHVTWFGAQAYCRWAGLRLPTEVEWEKAARGSDARLFPWGNEWHDNHLRWQGGTRAESETTAPVDAYPQGCSQWGICQMAGNVEEWCEDWYQPNAYVAHAAGNRQSPHDGSQRVLRGGNCLGQNRLEFRCAMRRASSPMFVTVPFTGIRCACDMPLVV